VLWVSDVGCKSCAVPRHSMAAIIRAGTIRQKTRSQLPCIPYAELPLIAYDFLPCFAAF
jgi:hypothetical protein